MKKVRWQERRHTLTKIFNYRNQGMNSIEIAEALNTENYLTHKGLKWKGNAVDNFVYCCRKAGMREQTIKKEKQQILSVQPVSKKDVNIDAMETFSNFHLKQVSSQNNITENYEFDLIKSIMNSNVETEKKRKAIVALLNG